MPGPMQLGVVRDDRLPLRRGVLTTSAVPRDIQVSTSRKHAIFESQSVCIGYAAASVESRETVPCESRLLCDSSLGPATITRACPYTGAGERVSRHREIPSTVPCHSHESPSANLYRIELHDSGPESGQMRREFTS